jgi:hypothetical protein
MQPPNSGISATTNGVIIKTWDWKSILTGITRKKHIKEICGINSFRHRQRRRPASSWTKHAIIKNNRHQKRRDKICKSVYY